MTYHLWPYHQPHWPYRRTLRLRLVCLNCGRQCCYAPPLRAFLPEQQMLKLTECQKSPTPLWTLTTTTCRSPQRSYAVCTTAHQGNKICPPNYQFSGDEVTSKWAPEHLLEHWTSLLRTYHTVGETACTPGSMVATMVCKNMRHLFSEHRNALRTSRTSTHWQPRSRRLLSVG